MTASQTDSAAGKSPPQPDACSASPQAGIGAARLAWALEMCRRMQLRLTPVRQAVLAYLALQQRPVTLESVARADGVVGSCNVTTVYRALIMFEVAQLVRRVSTTRRIAHFALNAPGPENHLLVCRKCGAEVVLQLFADVVELINRAVVEQRFAVGDWRCEIHGLCRNCQSPRQTAAVPATLRP